ncbi:phosphoribosylaminoimidazolesuccinocarboxamide synthase [Candidatus Woesearchaeota archaeon]|nr:phosphoribosylaminoimidazolesuccinocarboxamide synthase [Candidatus Woesearchaeota archaeon]
MGSVKDLIVSDKPKVDDTGLGWFIFSDRYSVFDWGEMPDLIPNKGAALCTMAAYCLEQAEEGGIRTHYLGVRESRNSSSKDTKNLSQPAHLMDIEIVRVIRPSFREGKYDYSDFNSNLTNYLIPLELIYRNCLLPSSSVFQRLNGGSATYPELGLTQFPRPGEKLSPPLLDVSTKLESKDRYLTWKEAGEISGLTTGELTQVKSILTEVNELVTEIAEKAGLVNEDGKIEVAFNPRRRLIVVDVVGTPDECRFTFEGVNVSKEVAREFYRKTEWYDAVQKAKEWAKERGVTNWKELCTIRPSSLPPALKEIISEMYMSTANAFLERKLFDSPRLAEVVDKYRKWEKEG